LDKIVNTDTTGSNRNARAVGITLGSLFALVGVAALVLLGVSLFRQADSMPLYYRVIGSLIAIVFLAVGGGLVYGALTSGSDESDR
jgi:hypothetical protein